MANKEFIPIKLYRAYRYNSGMNHNKKEIVSIPRGDRKLIRTIWQDVPNPVGLIQIVRTNDDADNNYDAFAQFMNTNGYIVSDYAQNENMHHAQCFDTTIDDEVAVIQYLVRRYHVPLFLFGQSYGGLVAQSVMERTNIPVAGACTAYALHPPAWTSGLGHVVAWAGARVFGRNARAKLLDMLMGAKGTHSYEFYHSMFHHLISMRIHTARTCPLLMIGGIRELAGMGGRVSRLIGGVWPIEMMDNITVIIYPDSERDDISNIKHTVFRRDMLKFFNAAV